MSIKSAATGGAPEWRIIRSMSERMETLAQGADELGLTLTGHHLDLFETYYRELVDWNSQVNLTAITDYQEVQVKHFLDSLTLVLSLDQGLVQFARMIDVGAGAGFPGVPLKIAFPQVSLTLADSVGKKTRFLEHIVRVLELDDVAVHTGRAEALAHQAELREGFDLALVRGVARLPVLLEYTLPFCRVGGRVVAWKHGGIQQELADGERTAPALGGKLGEVCPVEAPGLTDDRVLVVVNKVEPTPDRFPRRPGIPAKRPL